MPKTTKQYTPEQIEEHCGLLESYTACSPSISPMSRALQIIRQLQELKDVDMELLAAAVHDAYCRHYVKTHDKPYWTNGDYKLLDEETKEIDRETVRAVLRQIAYTKRI